MADLPRLAPVIVRWVVAAVAALVLVITPVAWRLRPVDAVDVPVTRLAAMMQASWQVGWSGVIESAGTVQIPQNDSFATLAQLLGQENELRVWWRAPDDYRVDRVRDAGETDLIRHHDTQISWIFESQTATISPTSSVRLPNSYDVLPPVLARQLLQGARVDELSALPAARIAGVDAAGLRLTPGDDDTSLGRIDLWADPRTGLPLRVELYGRGAAKPALSTTFSEVDPTRPDARSTAFVPNPEMTINYDQSVDVAAAANAFAPVDLPPTLAGLSTRDGTDPGAVGIYGHGPTTLIVVPLRGSVAGPLRRQFAASAAAKQSSLGTSLAVGPVSVLLSARSSQSRGPGRSFLMTGTVTPEVLRQAASELSGSRT